MKIGILGRNANNWGIQQLRRALNKQKVSSSIIHFSQIATSIQFPSYSTPEDVDNLRAYDALIVRPIGRGSLEEIIFRMDLLRYAKRQGILVINPPDAIEKCVDKYYALSLLEEGGFRVPQTIVTESIKGAIEGFHQLGGDIIVKPLFGSQGVGTARISNAEIARRTFRSLRFQHNVLYLQKFIPHDNKDIRVFVAGNRVISAMKRIGKSWKTNISQGAQPYFIKLSKELEKLAIKASKLLGCEISGVDILEDEKGPVILEVNSQPGWRGLQSVAKVNIADGIVSHILTKMRK